MNKSYRSIFNEQTGTYVAAPEVAKAKGKRSKSGAVVATVAGLFMAGSMLALSGAHAAVAINEANVDVFCGGLRENENFGFANSAESFEPNCQTTLLGLKSQTTNVEFFDGANLGSGPGKANSISVGGYQYINGKDASGNALTVATGGLAINGKDISGNALTIATGNIAMGANKITGLAQGLAGTAKQTQALQGLTRLR